MAQHICRLASGKVKWFGYSWCQGTASRQNQMKGLAIGVHLRFRYILPGHISSGSLSGHECRLGVLHSRTPVPLVGYRNEYPA